MAISIKGRHDASPIQTQKSGSIIAAIDIGSAKVTCFIAKVKKDDTIDVIGIGHHASAGVKSGTIVDLKAAETAIGHAIQAAENMARAKMLGQQLTSVYVNLPGTSALCHNFSVDVKISGQEITGKEIKAALSEARKVEVAGQDELIHTIPAGFSIDGRHGISEPRGMYGNTLTVHLNAITGLSPALRNKEVVIGNNHLDINGYCAAPYASGLSCLVEDERELGCTIIDMGGGTTNIGVFFGGKIIFTSAIPIGGQHVTSDVARGLTTSISDAERLKILYGAAMTASADDTDLIDVPLLGENTHNVANHIPRSILTGIIQPRIEETFELVRAKLEDAGMSQVAGRRVVLTGGASQLPGLCELGQLILDKKLRVGAPVNMSGLAESTSGPAFSTAAGLLIYAAKHAAEQQPHIVEKVHLAMPGTILEKVGQWLRANW